MALIARPEAQMAHNQEMQLVHLISELISREDFDAEKIDKMLNLQVRVLEKNAEMAFASAYSKMRAEIPVILKTQKGHTGSYADLATINNIVDPVLARYGFSTRFQTEQQEGKAIVTCILQHEGGHKETATMVFPYDDSGKKTAIHAAASAITYGRRYTKCAILDIATTDDDGISAQAQKKLITEKQVCLIRELIAKGGVEESDVLKYAGVDTLEELPASKFNKICVLLHNKIKQKEANNAGA